MRVLSAEASSNGALRKAPATPGERVERKQQHDRADDREQKRHQVEAEADRMPEDDVADHPSDEGAGDADDERRQAAHPPTPRRDEPRDDAGKQSEDDPREDHHRGTLTWWNAIFA